MNLSEEIFKRYGFVKRARGNFLYTSKSKRLTDLYRADGNAVLGWGGTGGSITPFTMLKNFLNRGLTGFFKTPVSLQADKAVSELFSSQRKTFFFYNLDAALFFCRELSADDAFVYVPWNSENFNPENKCVVIKAPLAWGTDIFIAAVSSELSVNPALLKNSVLLPPALLSAVNRSIYDLIKALQNMKEKDWFIYDTILTKYFKREGPYLIPKVPYEKYESFVLHCLDLGIVLNPDYEGMSIVPFNADKGLFKCLKNNPFEF